MSDDVTGQASRNVEVGLRVAMQLGQYLAQIRQQQLIKAEQESKARAAQMRRVLNTERELARPILEQAVTQAFWDVATPDDAAKAYGLAKRFEHVDGQAAVSARKIEQEVLERWGVDLTVSSPVEVQDAIEQAVQHQVDQPEPLVEGNPWMQAVDPEQSLVVPPPPIEVGEAVANQSPVNLGPLHDVVPKIPGDPYTEDDWLKAISEAVAGVVVQESATGRLQERADEALIEAREAQAEMPGETTPEVEALEEYADTVQRDAFGAWDTLEARENYAAWLQDKAPESAIRARVTADKGFTKPGNRSVEKRNKTVAAKRLDGKQHVTKKKKRL